VERTVTLLQSELKRSMMLLGCDDVKKLGPQYLRATGM
jgi:isopentenyl diphosphate isomerase/L-lactate dehydrogenase-like FMN-dependent dehydrogenase